MAFAAAAFVLVFAIVIGAYWIFVLRPEHSADSALRRRVRVAGTGPSLIDVSVRREVERLSGVPLLNRLLSSRAAVTAPIHRLVEQSGVGMTVGVFLLAAGSLGMFGFVVGQWWTRSKLLGLLIGLVLAGLPYGYLAWRRAKRVARFEELFPEALTLMTRAMRAGHTFITAIGMVADEMHPARRGGDRPPAAAGQFPARPALTRPRRHSSQLCAAQPAAGPQAASRCERPGRRSRPATRGSGARIWCGPTASTSR